MKEYTPRKTAEIEDIIESNKAAANIFLKNTAMHAWHDPDTKTNAMAGKYKPNMLVIGKPNAGKSHLVDAVLNKIHSAAESNYKKIEFIDLNHISSVYKGGAILKLGKVLEQEKARDDTIFYNVLRADCTMLSNKETISGFKKFISQRPENSMNIGISYPDECDPALMHRFTAIEAVYPRQEKDYSILLRAFSKRVWGKESEKYDFDRLGKLTYSFFPVGIKDVETIVHNVAHKCIDNLDEENLFERPLNPVRPATNKMFEDEICNYFKIKTLAEDEFKLFDGELK